MPHNKVFAVCENKCFVETLTKDQINNAISEVAGDVEEVQEDITDIEGDITSIEERLTALGFKSGSVTASSVFTLTSSSLTKQGQYALLSLTASVNSTPRGWFKIPNDFAPGKVIYDDEVLYVPVFFHDSNDNLIASKGFIAKGDNAIWTSYLFPDKPSSNEVGLGVIYILSTPTIMSVEVLNVGWSLISNSTETISVNVSGTTGTMTMPVPSGGNLYFYTGEIDLSDICN